MHSLKKLLGLTVLYAVLIVGIFIIQFRNDSTIIKKDIRGIKVTLVGMKNQDGETVLKNEFQLSYNGISFLGDNEFPVTCSENGAKRTLKLISAEETGSSFILNFEKDIKIIFSSEGEEPSLTISAEMDDSIESVNLKFLPESEYSIVESKDDSIVFAGSDAEFALNANVSATRILTLKNGGTPALYAVAKEENKYSLDNIEELELASKTIYNATLNLLPELIISKFMAQRESDTNFGTNLDEQTVISFLSSMMNANRYNEGIESVPRTFVNGTKRTFRSSPFFGAMVDTVPTLTMQIERFNDMIASAVQERSLNVFTVDQIAQYMYTQGNRGNVLRLVRMSASMSRFEPTVLQAAGIIRAYLYFKEQGSSMAPPFEPVLETCVQKIMDSCSLKGKKAILTENGRQLEPLQAITAGEALVNYGEQTSQERIEQFGCLIVNSHVENIQNMDLQTISMFYPVLIHSNKRYPHYELIRTMDRNNIWTYTIAQNVRYTLNRNTEISLIASFPTGLSHYMFISGIRPFDRIRIDGNDIQTDARFENYDASGYVYRNNTQTLLLKLRQNSMSEIIDFF